MLTAREDEVDKILGLELGADDYITKPYRVKELLSRIATNLRRARVQGNMDPTVTGSGAEIYTFGKHRFYLQKLRLMDGEQPVDLTPSELRLLRELIRNEGQVLTRNQLLERLYDTGESFVDDNTLSVYMKRLRDKLGVDADRIDTVRGIGYRFRKESDYAE